MLVDLTLKDQLKKFLQSERKPEKKKILGSIREERNNNNKKYNIVLSYNRLSLSSLIF